MQVGGFASPMSAMSRGDGDPGDFYPRLRASMVGFPVLILDLLLLAECWMLLPAMSRDDLAPGDPPVRHPESARFPGSTALFADSVRFSTGLHRQHPFSTRNPLEKT